MCEYNPIIRREQGKDAKRVKTERVCVCVCVRMGRRAVIRKIHTITTTSTTAHTMSNTLNSNHWLAVRPTRGSRACTLVSRNNSQPSSHRFYLTWPFITHYRLGLYRYMTVTRLAKVCETKPHVPNMFDYCTRGFKIQHPSKQQNTKYSLISTTSVTPRPLF